MHYLTEMLQNIIQCFSDQQNSEPLTKNILNTTLILYKEDFELVFLIPMFIGTHHVYFASEFLCKNLLINLKMEYEL